VRRILHCTGSPTNDDWADLSRLYARGALEALAAVPDTEHLVVDVSPDGTWRFPDSLHADALASAQPCDLQTALSRLAALTIDVGVPQLFCPPGLTDHRALLSVLGVASVGNSATTMALTADKALARAVVASAGIDVPDAVLVRRGDPLPDVSTPVVVKPVDTDNSAGVHYVDEPADLGDAVTDALARAGAALVETFVPLGREVRCGTIVHGGELIALPLEEYAVDPVERPIRRADDKLARDHDGELGLMAKTSDRAWIVPVDDPVVPAVHELARQAHIALGCGHHGLVDVRIDPDGRPWFLEAGPYCSFAPSSVVVTMADSLGIELVELFEHAVDFALESGREPTWWKR